MSSFVVLTFPDVVAWDAAKQDFGQDGDTLVHRAIWSGAGVPPIRVLVQTENIDVTRQICAAYGGDWIRVGSEREFVERALVDTDVPAVFDVFDVDAEPPPDEARQLRDDNARLNQENEDLADANQELRAVVTRHQEMLTQAVQERDRAQRDMEDFAAAKDAVDELQERLTSAEEKNAALLDELRDITRERDALVYGPESKPDDTVRVHLGPPGSPKAIDRVTVGGQLLRGVVEANICQRVREAATLEVEIASFEVVPYDFATQPFQVALLSDEGLARAAERVALDIEAASEGGLHQLVEIGPMGRFQRATCSCRWTSLPYPERGDAFDAFERHARKCQEALRARR